MRWIPALLALLGLSLVFLGGAWGNLGLLAYHAVCAVAILRHRRTLRPLFAWRPGLGAWTLGTSLAFLAGLAIIPLLWDPASVRGAMSFPSTRAFAFTAAYTMLVHASLEAVFWRGVFTDVDVPRGALWGNALTFYAVHVIVLTAAIGAWGWVAALPTAAAGLAWAWVTLRTRSLWPALVSHWAADAAILAGMAFYYLRS